MMTLFKYCSRKRRVEGALDRRGLVGALVQETDSEVSVDLDGGNWALEVKRKVKSRAKGQEEGSRRR